MELTVDQALQQAVAAHQEGKLQDAERLYRAILQAKPKHPDANHNLGVLAVAVGKPLEALPLFQQALDANPKVEQFWLSYISILISDGQIEQAHSVISDAKRHGVHNAKLSELLERIKLAEAESEALTHYQSGRLELAETFATNLTRDFPESPFGWKLLGAIFGNAGKKAAALGAHRRAAELSPDDPEAQYNLGTALKNANLISDAKAAYEKAIALKPDYASAHNNLASCLKMAGQLEEAELIYLEALRIQPKNPEFLNNLGTTLQALGRMDEAVSSFEKAVLLNPNYAVACSNLGITLKSLGRFDEAEACYHQALDLDPSLIQVYRNLSEIKRFKKQDALLKKMHEVYQDQSLPDSDRCHISFALAKASEDLEDYAGAFQYYSKGNSLRKQLLAYEPATDVELFQRLKTSELDLAKFALKRIDVLAEVIPIFIVGMPRSGTTLVEQIVSSHSRVEGAGELKFVAQFGHHLATGQHPINYGALRNFRDQYLKSLKRRVPAGQIITDKMPQNFRYLGLLAAALPEAKFVHVIREPAAVCWANYVRMFPAEDLSYCYDLKDIINYHELYRDLMRCWHEAFGHRIIDLIYERVTTDQEDETRRLIEYLGLGWEDSCLHPEKNKRGVATASNMQVRSGIYQGSSDRWKLYKPFLNGVLDQLDTAG